MKDKKIIISIVLLITVIIITIGTTYAFFTANIQGSESSQTVSIAGGTLSITVNGGNNINIQNIVPGSNAIATKTITIVGTNTIDLTMPYTMYLEIDGNTFSNNAISYTLTSSNPGSSGTIIPSISTNQSIYTGTSTIELGSGNFVKANNITHTYQLKIYFLETESDQNIDQGKSISGHIRVEATEATEPNTWASPKAGTLLKAVKDSYSVTSPTTTPGRQISTADEKVLASTDDDYGTSYYFRGSVDKNYVEFAGMCWRIVRVTGDNSIKLVLYNNNESGALNPCSVSSSTAAFARHTGTTYTSAFNSTYDQNAYVGFKYGTPGSATYTDEHANINKSTILTNLEKWYNLRLKDYTRYLADTIWCNDKSVDTVYPYGNSLGYGANQTGYSARGRIYAGGSYATAANPSLVCPDAGSDNKLSKFSVSDRINGNGNLTYKVGLLTIDEVAYAGARYYNADGSSDNSTYYLNQNATGTWWWSLSPNYFNGTNASVCDVSSAGYLYSYYVNNAGGLRPAVSLVSTTKITSGNGTSSTPYIIQTTL